MTLNEIAPKVIENAAAMLKGTGVVEVISSQNL
jgi:hypothetical protein